MITPSALVAALGIKPKVVLVGAIGAFVSLRFFPGLSAWERLSTFVGGLGIAVFGAEPLTEWLGLRPSAETGFALLLGIFGMSLAASVVRVIRDTDWSSIIKAKGGA